MGLHLLDELPDRNLGAKVDHVALVCSPVNLVVVDLDDSVVLRVLFGCGAGAEADRR